MKAKNLNKLDGPGRLRARLRKHQHAYLLFDAFANAIQLKVT